MRPVSQGGPCKSISPPLNMSVSGPHGAVRSVAACIDAGLARLQKEQLQAAARQGNIVPQLQSAIDELARAIDGVERAALRQSSKADLVSELALMRIDRNKLAEALDDALARIKTLEAARITAGEKLDGAIAALKAVLAKEAKD
jgi:hypothetical protein